MAVPLIDFGRQHDYLRRDMEKAISLVIEHGRFILGPEVKRLEQEIAALCGVKHGVAVASGTDALLLALDACGVRGGDEVIVPDFSFFSTAGVVSRLGATPVFVDIEPDTYNIDPDLIEKAITDRTKAIMPVHLFGQCADMDRIMAIAQKHNLPVVEDAAQAIGAEYNGRAAGSMGDYGCFSFYPTKNLGAAGDAGIIVTDKDENAERLRMLRVHGQSGKYEHSMIGYNSRLDTMQAALLLIKLPHLRTWSEQRIEHAARYDEAFADVPSIVTPVVKDYTTFHIYNQYTLASPKRDAILAGLQEAEIGYCVYYPIPFHKQPCFASLGYKPNQLPVAARAAEEVFSIAVYPELTDEEQQEVIETISRLARG
ncbi:aminotransferase class I/II-fold pyridoxal phosphate-dependent enzyme [candidate division GN15 bacterium]|nr:aminotransferase class I/II-fold pyridoxal phosphate-dependent enzyme [candidate division GN15 bacterium]